jgi:hypothetical protein
MAHRRFPSWGAAPDKVERRQRRGASGAPMSKSTQSADKVYFSDSTSGMARKPVTITILVTVTNDHDCSRSIKYVRFLSQLPVKHDKIVFIGCRDREPEVTEVITLPARKTFSSVRKRRREDAAGDETALRR